MLGWVECLLLAPFRLVLLLCTMLALFRPAPKQQRRAADALEAKRKRLNAQTLAALEVAPDPTKPIPQDVLNRLHQLHVDQIAMEDEVKGLLADRAIREEQGVRAAAVAVQFQVAILLRRAELRCAELAYIEHADGPEDAHQFDLEMQYANGDLDTAGAGCASVIGDYMRRLQARAMRRERLARRLIWLMTFRWRGALDRDPGLNDIRQQVRGFVSSIDEQRDVLKVFGSDFLSGALSVAATEYADADDATLVKMVTEVVERAARDRLEPVDRNYPVLITRLWAIRDRFEELPAWSWSMRWKAFCSVLLGWLYLFAAEGAESAHDRGTAGQMRRQAFASHQRGDALIAETALLERGLKPLMTSFGNLGRQRTIPGFAPPPSKERLLDMADALFVRLRRRA